MKSLPTFTDSFRHGRNRFGTLRHLLALAVLVDHAFILSGQAGVLGTLGYQTELGSVAVACFFLLSGALVTASWVQNPALIPFATKRALRLLPGYLVCLLVTVVAIGPLAWLLEHGEIAGYGSAMPGPFGYLLHNSLLIQVQLSIGDLFANHAQTLAVNGSLWSIPWEAACYGMVAVLGVTHVFARYSVITWVLVLAALANALLLPPGSVLGQWFLSERVVLLPMYFLSGAAFYLYRQRIPRSPWLGCLAIAATVVGGCYSWPLVAMICLPYAFFFLATIGVEPTGLPKREQLDLSYGIYIYGFPVQQLLLDVGIGGGSLGLLAVSLLVVLPLAYLSWTLVEAPALRFKPVVNRSAAQL